MNRNINGLGEITHWGAISPNEFYARALRDSPIIYDGTLKSWVIYSYNECKSVLLNDAAQVPPIDVSNPLMSHRMRSILQNMARLCSNSQHMHARNAAFQVFKTMRPVDIGELINSLIPEKDPPLEIDWVSVICKKLPVLFLAKGLGFDMEACDFIISNIKSLVKIMVSEKTADDILYLNPVVENFAKLTESLIFARPALSEFVNKENSDLIVANLLSLLIQSYDAGGGLLCNTVIQLAAVDAKASQREKTFFYQHVIETLRFDPPVHLTRRVAARDITLGSHQINKGEQIVLVLAAANLDPKVFAAPLNYDISRINNGDHLTFGAGGHMCLAKHLMADLTSEACSYLFKRFGLIRIPEQNLTFEPQLNVRLIKQLNINLSNQV